MAAKKLACKTSMAETGVKVKCASEESSPCSNKIMSHLQGDPSKRMMILLLMHSCFWSALTTFLTFLMHSLLVSTHHFSHAFLLGQHSPLFLARLDCARRGCSALRTARLVAPMPMYPMTCCPIQWSPGWRRKAASPTARCADGS